MLRTFSSHMYRLFLIWFHPQIQTERFWANVPGAPLFAQETECADTTVLLQKPRPRAFAHQEWQPLSFASQHIERTASSSHFTVSGSNLRLAIFMTTALSENHRRFSVQNVFWSADVEGVFRWKGFQCFVSCIE